MLRSELVVHKSNILTTRLEINEKQLDYYSVGLMVLYCAALGGLLAQVPSKGVSEYCSKTPSCGNDDAMADLARRYFVALPADDDLEQVMAEHRAAQKIYRYILWHTS
ncbi:hypothetical protein [Pseudomonas sp. NPDC087336]|uniref:hypothetical protein n=1 Tax=Pseudomonas sp. NPDC087336 TaxID=3364436 RepID=UPI0038068B7F